MLRFALINFDSIFRSTIRSRFDFFTICTPLLTQLDLCVAAWELQCCGAGHPRSYPPQLLSSSAWTGKMLSGQSTDQTVWRCNMELKLPSWTARRHTLTLSIVCCRCPLSDVWTSPTLVNRPTCLHAYNTRVCRYQVYAAAMWRNT